MEIHIYGLDRALNYYIVIVANYDSVFFYKLFNFCEATNIMFEANLRQFAYFDRFLQRQWRLDKEIGTKFRGFLRCTILHIFILLFLKRFCQTKTQSPKNLVVLTKFKSHVVNHFCWHSITFAIFLRKLLLHS